MSNIKESFYSYDELKRIVNELNIKTKNDYIKKYKSLSEFGKKAPLNPLTFYGKDVWQNWSIFLNKPIYKKKHNNLYYSYTECKNIIIQKNIKSKTEFYKKIKELINNDIGIPYNPRSVYIDEWEGWGIFLGTGRIQDNLKKYLPFEEARLWARSLNLKIYKEWRHINLNFLPSNIPKKPEKTYKNKGWVDYFDWLGIEKKGKISFGEKIIFDYLENNQITFIYDKSVLDCKNEHKLRFDFYLPKKNICIEFDGIQHFKPIDFFGGEVEFSKTKMRDEIKNIFCTLNNIKLIRIPYYLNNVEIIEFLKKEVI